MISDLFTVTVLVGILASGIRLSTPYLFAAIGETFGQKAVCLIWALRDKCSWVLLPHFTSR